MILSSKVITVLSVKRPLLLSYVCLPDLVNKWIATDTLNNRKRMALVPLLQMPAIDKLYEDSDIFVIDKPSGLLSVPGILPEDKLVYKYKRPRFQEWGAAIAYASSNLNTILSDKTVTVSFVNTPERVAEIGQVLHKMTFIESIPRKQRVFLDYLTRVFKMTDADLKAQLWSIVYDVDNKLHKRRIDEIPIELISAIELVEKQCGHKIYAVHRLDMDTSGILVLAKTFDACADLGQQFRDRIVEKEYIALVDGVFDDVMNHHINIPIRPDTENRPYQMVDYVDGKQSETIAKTINVYHDNQTSLVRLKPLTGRTHQLRMHTSCLSHPIIGDNLYHKVDERRTLMNRLCLHAYHISFNHPTTKIRMSFHAKNSLDFINARDKDKYLTEDTIANSNTSII